MDDDFGKRLIEALERLGPPVPPRPDHRVDDLVDSFFNEEGDRVSVYRNGKRSHFKLLVDEAQPFGHTASIELGAAQWLRLYRMIGDSRRGL